METIRNSSVCSRLGINMAQWDVGDVVDLLRLYRVPNSALNFVYRHNIDGESMDEGVELIVKDLKLNSLQTEEAIVAKWKEVSDSALSPQEALNYGTSKLPDHLFANEDDQEDNPHHSSGHSIVNDNGVDTEQVNGILTIQSHTIAVDQMDQMDQTGNAETIESCHEDNNADQIEPMREQTENLRTEDNLVGEDDTQSNALCCEEVSCVALVDTSTEDKEPPDTMKDIVVHSTEPTAEAPISVDVDDYGNDFEPDEPVPILVPAPVPKTGVDIKIAEDTNNDFDADVEKVDGNPPPQHHHVHFAAPATPPHHHHSVHRVTSNEEIPDLSATIEKQTREYEMLRQQRAMQRYGSEESVHTEGSLAMVVARQNEEVNMKHRLEKYHHEMVQQSELLRLQEERIKLQDLLLQQQRSTIATLSPRGNNISNPTHIKEHSPKVHQHAGMDAGEDDGGHDLYNFNINYEQRDNYTDQHSPAFERSYPPNLLYDNISQLSGSEVFDTPVNYTTRQPAQLPLVDSSITSVNSAELEQNNLVALHYGYQNRAGLYPQENYHHTHLEAGSLERMEPFAPPNGSRNGGKRPVSGSVLRTPTAPAQEFIVKQGGHHVGQVRTVYSAGNKRRDSGHRGDETAHNNMHRELYQGSTDSAGNVWHHHREPAAVAQKPTDEYPLRDRVFVPHLPLTGIAPPVAPIDSHPVSTQVRQPVAPVRRAQSPPPTTNNHHITVKRSKDEPTSSASRQQAADSAGAAAYSGAPVGELMSLIKELSECNRALLQAIRPSSAPSTRRPTARHLAARAEPQSLTSRTAFTNTAGSPAPASDFHHPSGHLLKQQYAFADQQLLHADHSPGSHRMSSQGNSPEHATAGGTRYTTEQAIVAIIKKLHDSPYRSRPTSSAGARRRPKSSNGVRSRQEPNSNGPPVSASRVEEYINNLVLELTAKDAAREKGSFLHAPPPQFVYVPQAFNNFQTNNAHHDAKQAIAAGNPYTYARPYYQPDYGMSVPAAPQIVTQSNHEARIGPETATADSSLLGGAHIRAGAPPRTVLLLRNGSGTIRDGPTYLRPRARDAKKCAASSVAPSNVAPTARSGTGGSARAPRKVRAIAEIERSTDTGVAAGVESTSGAVAVNGAVAAPPPAKMLQPKKPASSVPSGRKRHVAGGQSAVVGTSGGVPGINSLQ